MNITTSVFRVHNPDCCTEYCDCRKPEKPVDWLAIIWGAVFSAPLWFLIFLWIVNYR